MVDRLREKLLERDAVRVLTRTEAGSTLAPGVSALSLEQLLARLA